MIDLKHKPEDIWNYTPYQALAFVKLGQRRERKKSARRLETATMAVRSDAKDINARIRKDWGD